MSLLDTAMERLDQLIRKRLDEREPFRATVDSVDSTGMVSLQRLEAASAEDELRARVPGGPLAAGDEVLCLPVNGKPVILGRVQRSASDRWVFGARLTADIDTTSDTAQVVSDFNFAHAASEVWLVEYILHTNCSGAGGIRFSYNDTGGAATGRLSVFGSDTSVTTITTTEQTSEATLTPGAVNSGAFSGFARGTLVLLTGSSTGTIQFFRAAGTSGQTARLRTNSAMRATRLI